MNNWNQKTVAVVGLGRTGLAATRFLRGLGAEVRATDDAPGDRLGPAIEEVRRLGGEFIPAAERGAIWAQADLCISSPGVPWRAPVLEEARRAGVEVVSELEFSSRFARGTILAVTGTNGKSTTTELLAHMLRACGLEALAGGNLGRPLCSMLEEDGPAVHHVVECSSFQLQGCTTFRPKVAVFLNFSPNHLDHHTDMAEYLESKCRIFQCQEADDFLIYNAEDAEVRRVAGKVRCLAVPFGIGPVAAGSASGMWQEGSEIWAALGGLPRPWMDTAAIPLPGPHNVENVMAAAAAALCLGAPLDRVRTAVRSFRALSHRMEPVLQARGVRVVDDSKATNVEAVRSAVRTFPKGLHLILGGRDKGGDWAGLRSDLEGRVRSIYLLGEAAGLIASALDGSAPMSMCSSMEEAVAQAWENAETGDTILLSPGCSSFDMFRDYAERGERFAQAAHRVAGGKLTACNGGGK